MQDCSNLSALAMELLQSCDTPSILESKHSAHPQSIYLKRSNDSNNLISYFTGIENRGFGINDNTFFPFSPL